MYMLCWLLNIDGTNWYEVRLTTPHRTPSLARGRHVTHTRSNYRASRMQADPDLLRFTHSE